MEDDSLFVMEDFITFAPDSLTHACCFDIEHKQARIELDSASVRIRDIPNLIIALKKAEEIHEKERHHGAKN